MKTTCYAAVAVLALSVAGCDDDTLGSDGPLPTITVQSAPIQLEVGQQTTVTAVVTGLTANTAVYSSTSPGVASVNPTTGVVTALSPGSTTIVAQSTEQASLRASVQVTVVAAPRTIVITPPSVQLFVGQSGALECVVTENGTPVTTAKAWSSNAGSIASVTNTGAVLGVAPGTAVITCSAPAFNLSTTRDVVVVPRHSITVTPAPVNLQVGGTQALTVTVTDASGNAVTGRTIMYESLNTSIATVSAAGVVSGAAAGSTEVKITVGGPGGGTANVAVNVTAATPTCGESGTYSMTVTLTADPAGHGPYIGMPSSTSVQVTRSGQTVSMTGASPFVSVNGAIDANCQMNLTGSGTVAGYANTAVRLTGALGSGQPQSWSYEMGTNGNLPGGQSATYTLTRQ